MVCFYDYNNLYETSSFDLLHIIWSLYKVKNNFEKQTLQKTYLFIL